MIPCGGGSVNPVRLIFLAATALVPRAVLAAADEAPAVPDLFAAYSDVRADLAERTEAARGIRDALREVSDRLRALRGEEAKEVRPPKADLREAENRLRRARHILNSHPPVKPRIVPPPRSPGMSASERRRLIEAQRKNRDELHRDRMRLFREGQAWAKEELPALEAAAQEAKSLVEEVTARYEDLAAPLLEEEARLRDQLREAGRAAADRLVRIREIGARLEAAGPAALHAHGIVAWDGEFYRLEDLEDRYDALKREVDAVAAIVRRQAEAAGKPLPDHWRHSDRDTLDAMKSVLDRARVSRREAP